MLADGRETAERMGDVRQQLLLSLNLAGLTIYAGRAGEALRLLHEVIDRAEATEQHALVTQAHAWLVRHYLLAENWTLAQAHHAAAHALATAQNEQAVLTMLDGYAAELALADGDLAHAWRLANAAVSGSQQLGDKTTEAIHWRVVGNVAAAATNRDHAAAAYQRSLALLMPHEYDFAATQLAFAAFLLEQGEPQEAARRLQIAQMIFVQLGATRDLAMTKRLLDQTS
jgi:tetratricopeptide (TPR) repeat protein